MPPLAFYVLRNIPFFTLTGMNSPPNSNAKSHEEDKDTRGLNKGLRFSIERKPRHGSKGEGLLGSRKGDSSLRFVGVADAQTWVHANPATYPVGDPEQVFHF